MSDFAWDTLFTNGSMVFAFVCIGLGVATLSTFPRADRSELLAWRLEMVGIVLTIALAYCALLALCAGLVVRG